MGRYHREGTCQSVSKKMAAPTGVVQSYMNLKNVRQSRRQSRRLVGVISTLVFLPEAITNITITDSLTRSTEAKPAALSSKEEDTRHDFEQEHMWIQSSTARPAECFTHHFGRVHVLEGMRLEE